MRITLVEDNISLAKGVAYQLQDCGHSVDMLHDGDDADVFLKQEGGDLIILDVNLPGKSGLELLANLRNRGDTRPVILLTAKCDIRDLVAGLDAGADDYLVKPFDMAELSARVRALARRGASSGEKARATVGQLEFDIGALQLFNGKTPIELPRREAVLLSELVKANGRNVSKSYLIDQLYGAGSEIDEQVIAVYASRLRKRLSPYNIDILVRRGIGYALASGQS